MSINTKVTTAKIAVNWKTKERAPNQVIGLLSPGALEISPLMLESRRSLNHPLGDGIRLRDSFAIRLTFARSSSCSVSPGPPSRCERCECWVAQRYRCRSLSTVTGRGAKVWLRKSGIGAARLTETGRAPRMTGCDPQPVAEADIRWALAENRYWARS